MIYQGDALQYIYETPGILQFILENEKEILNQSKVLLEERKVTELYLTGSGSSYNAAVAVSAFARKILGIRVTPVYPVIFMEESEIVSKDAVVLGISQQGTSMAVIRSLDKIREKGMTAISVTGEYDTEITKHGEANIYIECGYEDAGATTKGYIATVLTLMLFVIMLAKISGKITDLEAEMYRKRLGKVIQNMQQVLEKSEIWCRKTAEKLKNSSDLILISGNNLRSSLLEGVLKFSETCRFPVRGYEAEEFMHGMYNAVTRQTDFLYLFPAAGYEVSRMERLFEYYEKQGFCEYAINYKSAAQNGNVLLCDFINDVDFSILEYMLPQQLLFVLTSRARKIDLNIPKDPDFHKYMGSKLEETDD